MVINKQNIKLIFGLKLKQLRVQKGLSFAQLSKAAGVSVSYLNEIEKGKKYPKTDKIIALAQALDVSYDQLVSLKLSKKMAPIAELLNSGILESLPLELFGLEPSTLLELISNAPTKINAFISTILKMARNYEMSRENFFLAALRGYQELHDNYFEELEEAVVEFGKTYTLDTFPSHLDLKHLLENEFGYSIQPIPLHDYQKLSPFRSVFLTGKNHLFIHPELTETQQAFLFGKELGFQFLKLAERPRTASMFEVKSFEEVLNNFKASYFSVALLIKQQEIIKDIKQLFSKATWEESEFLAIMEKYKSSPEMFLSRMTNILPKFFQVENIFFLRFNQDLSRGDDYYAITKEIHLNRMHSPHRNEVEEHYCRRWVSIKILRELREQLQAGSTRIPLVQTQVSEFAGNKNEYFCISISKPNSPAPHSNVSVTLGIWVDPSTKKKIKFLDGEEHQRAKVGETCQRCSIMDCESRVSPPVIIRMRESRQQINKQLRELSELYGKAVEKSAKSHDKL